MFVCLTLQISLGRRSYDGRRLATDALLDEKVPVVSSLKTLATCESPKVVNLRGDGCVDSADKCPSGSFESQGRCRCQNYVNLAGTGCVSQLDDCDPHTIVVYTTDNPVYMCTCDGDAGFVLNAAKTACVCSDATPVLDSPLSKCIAAGTPCSNKYYALDATKNECVCAEGNNIHANGTCDNNACGSFTNETQVSPGVCKCAGEKPIFDDYGQRCINVNDFCSSGFNLAVNVSLGTCVHKDGSDCKKISLNQQKCLDSCSEADSTDIADSKFCGCKSGFVLKDGVCVAPSTIQCASPNFFHIDGQCSSLPCGAYIMSEMVISGTNICQCVGGLQYIGICYSIEGQVYGLCGQEYNLLEDLGTCVSNDACTNTIGGYVRAEDEYNKYCECEEQKILSTSHDTCVQTTQCPTNSAPGSSYCKCNHGFVPINNTCVNAVCADGKVFNLQRNGCISDAECIAAGGYVDQKTYVEATYKICECTESFILSPGRDKCASWLPNKCGGNARVICVGESLESVCLDGFHLESNVCVKDVTPCVSPNFLHVDGTCTTTACGSANITGEKIDSAAGAKCVCANDYSFDGTSTCVIDCKATGYINFDGKSCVSSCGTGSTDQVSNAGNKCACKADYSVGTGANANSCVIDCKTTGYINFAGTACVTACGDHTTTQDPKAGHQCSCDASYSAIKGACVLSSTCVGGVKHISGLCDEVKCGNVTGEKNDSTATACTCAQETQYLAADGKSCLATCPAGHFASKLNPASPRCVAACPDGKPHDKENVCVESCAGMQKADASKKCVTNKGKLAVAVAVPVAVVVCVVVVVAVWLVAKKGVRGKSKPSAGAKNVRDDEVFSTNKKAKRGNDETTYTSYQPKRIVQLQE